MKEQGDFLAFFKRKLHHKRMGKVRCPPCTFWKQEILLVSNSFRHNCLFTSYYRNMILDSRGENKKRTCCMLLSDWCPLMLCILMSSGHYYSAKLYRSLLKYVFKLSSEINAEYNKLMQCWMKWYSAGSRSFTTITKGIIMDLSSCFYVC